MGSALALAEAKKLQAAIIRRGAKCTIELMAGRPWTGDQWYSRKYILMNHHTAGPMSGLTPSYAICRKGRSDVPGPLCNGYGGRDLVFRIVTMGLANHPGAGGPLTIDGVTLPKDSARISSFGIEWEHNGLSTWPPNMLPFMGRVGAGVLDYLSRRTINSIEHKTWTTRKIDRDPNFTRSGSTGQALITQYRGGIPPVSAGGPEKWDAADWAAFNTKGRPGIQAGALAAINQVVPYQSGGVAAWAKEIGASDVNLRRMLEYVYVSVSVNAKAGGALQKLISAGFDALSKQVAAGEAADMTPEQFEKLLEDVVVDVSVNVQDDVPDEPPGS